MALHSRAVKYTPSEEAFMAASRLINSKIRGWYSGAERRDIARESSDPALRQAALIMDAFDAARPSVRQAGPNPSSGGGNAYAGASPAIAPKDGAR